MVKPTCQQTLPTAFSSQAAARSVNMLPSEVRQEILTSYADILRVGRAVINGREVRWDTTVAAEDKLKGCAGAFCSALQDAAGLATCDESFFHKAFFYFCKAVSINYGLADVLKLITKKFGATCSIKTCGAGALVTYGADIMDAHSMQVHINFCGQDNIIYISPRSGKSKVRGTLMSVATDIQLPVLSGSTPEYRVELRKKGSKTSELVSVFRRRVMRRKPRAAKTIFPADPLAFQALETAIALLELDEAKCHPQKVRSISCHSLMTPSTESPTSGTSSTETGSSALFSRCRSSTCEEEGLDDLPSDDEASLFPSMPVSFTPKAFAPQLLPGQQSLRALSART